MTKTRDIVLGEQTFAVPVLPLRHNRVIYPLCRALSADPEAEDSFLGRLLKSGGTPDSVTEAEFDKLIEIAFHAAQASKPGLTRDEFDSMPITPPELLNAFFPVRLQTGAWLTSDATPGTDDDGNADVGPDGEPVTGEAAGD